MFVVGSGSLDASPSPQRIQRATSSDLDGALRKIVRHLTYCDAHLVHDVCV